MRDTRAGPGRFPCSLVDRSAEEAPDFAPATSPRLSRSTSPRPSPTSARSPRKFPTPTPGAGARRLRPRSARFRAGACLRGVTRRFLAYAFPPRSPDPHHLAVLARPGFVRAASHPTRHHPGQAALSFVVLLRPEPRSRSFTATQSTSASRRAPHIKHERTPSFCGRRQMEIADHLSGGLVGRQASATVTALPTMRIRPSPRANCQLAVRVTDD
jgi:hypothetical protein